MLFLGIELGIIIGLTFKGKFGNLVELNLKAFYLILVALAIQIIIIASPVSTNSFILQFGNIIYISSIILLLIGLSLNWSMGWGFRLLIFGAALNFFVITVNLGAIPVDVNKLSVVSQESVSQLNQEFDSHTYFNYRRPIDNDTVFNWLGDVIYIPVPLLNTNVYSYGDICISLGLCWFTIDILKGNTKRIIAPERPRRLLG